jgi:small subunit ribosomal protein S13
MGANDKQGKQIIRLMNTDVPGSLGTQKALAKIKGIGQNLSAAICARMDLDRTKAINSYSDVELKELEVKVKAMNGVESWQLNRQKDYDTGNDKHLLTTDLKLQLDFDKKRLSKIKSYRGLRLQARLPVRGQRTKGHFRKGGKSVGVKRKKK